jgi:hypothetical protein
MLPPNARPIKFDQGIPSHFLKRPCQIVHVADVLYREEISMPMRVHDAPAPAQIETVWNVVGLMSYAVPYSVVHSPSVKKSEGTERPTCGGRV